MLMKEKNSVTGAFLLVFVTLLCARAERPHSLIPLSGFGPSGSGSIQAGEAGSFITTDSSQRGICVNPVTGNLVFVDRQGGGNSSNFTGAIYILNPTNGTIITNLPTNGIQGGLIADVAVGVADDGAIYMGNVIDGTNGGPFKIYRWASETATADPTVAYSGNPVPSNSRWGDTMDVRGSGTDTQIAIGSRVSGQATRMAIFTTTDGLNFVVHEMTTDVVNSAFAGGVAFAEGNTFWAKRTTLPLRLFSFDLNSNTVTTLKSYTLPQDVTQDSLAVDVTNKVLAMMDLGNSTRGDRVFLYDISNPADDPQLLDIFDLPIDTSNSSGTANFLSFGGGKLYAHSLNNGLYAFDLAAGPLPAPQILTQPVGQSGLAGNTVKFKVEAQRAFGFQWQKGAVPIPNATNSTLTLLNIQSADAGNYSVVVSNSTSTVTSSNASLTVLSLEDFYRLTPLWATAANAQPYTSQTGGSASTPNQRSLAYNSFSNHLYVVSRNGSSSSTFNIYVVDAETGAQLYTLNTNSADFTGFAGQIGLVSIDVSDDGSIYACNVDSSGAWKLYRWADGNSNTVPVKVFDGDPFGFATSIRWGDAMDVRGGGVNTEIIIDGQQATSPATVILRPIDASLTSFSSTVFVGTITPTVPVGRSLQFGLGDSAWQKRFNNPTLIHSTFDLNAPFSSVTVDGTYTNFPTTLTQVAIDDSKHLLGAIDYVGIAGVSPDQVVLYDFTDPNAPIRLSQVNFPANKRANSQAIGKIIFAGDKMFALDSQNGVVATRVIIGALPPALTLVRSGDNVVLSWTGNDFVLEAKTNLTSAVWSSVTYQAGSTNTAADPISGQAKFYRLRK